MIYTIMKNTARLILAAIAVAAALVSCTKDLNPGKADTGSEAGTLRTITVSFNTPTKAYLDGLKPHFSKGDSILVKGSILSGDQRQTVYDTCIVSVKNGIATISTELTGRLQAYYPLASTKIEPDSFTQFVPPMQTGRFDDANICKADISSEGTMATFENLFPILRFYAGEGIGVDTIRIKSSEVLAGLEDTTVITVTPPKVDENIAQGVALVEEQEPVQDPRIWYVAVRGNVNANDLTFESVTNTQGTVEKTPTTDLQLEKGKIYNAFIPYYIDLGDAGKWAYCNVGAFLPEEPGLYFAWGDTTGYKWIPEKNCFEEEHSFTWATYLWNGGNEAFNQDYFDTVKSDLCPEGKLALKYDAANSNWGGKWRMPTKAERTSVGDSLSFVDGGVSFHALFFPAAGTGDEGVLNGKGSGGGFWTNTPSLNGDHMAYGLDFYSGVDKEGQVIEEIRGGETDRYMGYTIRPIFDETLSEDQPTTVTIQAYTDGQTL